MYVNLTRILHPQLKGVLTKGILLTFHALQKEEDSVL